MIIESSIIYGGLAAASSILTLLVKGYFNHRKTVNEKKKVETDEKEVDNKFLLESLKITVDLITKQRDEAYTRMEKMQERIVNLELEIMGMKMMMGHDPFPRWIVNTDGRYLFVNAAYEKNFLLDKNMTEKDVIGKYHADVWDKKTADHIKRIDARASKSPKGIAKSDINIGTGGAPVTVFKMPLKINDVLVGWIGYALEAQEADA